MTGCNGALACVTIAGNDGGVGKAKLPTYCQEKERHSIQAHPPACPQEPRCNTDLLPHVPVCMRHIPLWKQAPSPLSLTFHSLRGHLCTFPTPTEPLLWGLLCGTTLWNPLAPSRQGTFHHSMITDGSHTVPCPWLKTFHTSPPFKMSNPSQSKHSAV